jgi:HEAT repeat protein
MRAFILGAACLLVAGPAAVHAGGTLLKKEDIPKTIARLKSRSAKDRATAAELLGRRGAVRSSDVAEAVKPLLGLLRDDHDANVRRAAAEALGNIGRELDETVAALVDAMKLDKAPAVRLAAIDALGQIGPEARAAVPELRQVAQAKDKDKKLSRAARLALKSINRK